RRRHTISKRDWSSDVCSSDLVDFWVREENVDRLEDIAEEIYRTMKQHYFERTDFNHERDPDFNGCIMVRNVFAGIKERTADRNEIGRASCRERGRKYREERLG